MSSLFIYSLLATFSLFLLTSAEQKNLCHFESIYQFGDSLSDTGNAIRVRSTGVSAPSRYPPYGETFPGRPTGRWSDGFIIIDFIAKALHLPLLNPYLERNVSFDHGVNFAVGGATAINTSFFSARGVENTGSGPLNVQLKWFETYLKSICPTPVEYICSARLRRALVLVGMIGASDINYSFFQGKSIQEVKTYLPLIVQAITSAVREVIRMGGVRIVVPGNIPIGCFPSYLTLFSSADPKDYDQIGCLKSYNELVVVLNNHIRRAVELLTKEFPNVVIIYSDHYKAFRTVIRRRARFGDRSSLASCCGIGGPYNYDQNRTCSSSGVPVCPNPAKYLNWDGIHFTQETYRQISEILIAEILSKMHCI